MGAGTGVMMLALAAVGSGVPTGEKVTPQSVISAPARYKGRTIVVTDIACADTPDGFLCLATAGSKTLRIEAGVLGAATTVEMNEHVIETCKGETALTKTACRFDAEVTPRVATAGTVETPNGPRPGARLYSGDIDLFRPRR